jgi:hypothetical protein
MHDDRVTRVVCKNDRNKLVEFEKTHIYISTNDLEIAPNRAIALYLEYGTKTNFEQLHTLLDKVYYDINHGIYNTGGTRELTIQRMEVESMSEYRLNLDVWGDEKNRIVLQFNIETLEKGKQNDVSLVYLTDYNITNLLELWEVKRWQKENKNET